MSNSVNWNSDYVQSCLHANSEKCGDGEYCVYFWQDRIGDVFYVGSGKGYRFNDASDKCRSPEFMEWYNRGGCSPKIVWYGLDKKNSIELERKLMKSFWKLGFPLVNKEGIKHREQEYRARAEITKRERGIKPYMHSETNAV